MLGNRFGRVALLCAVLFAAPVFGQATEASAPAEAKVQAQANVLPIGTVVDLDIADHVNSKTSNIGDQFRIRLAQPIVVDGHDVVPAGIEGVGEVIHAARARAGGKAGELILAARSLNWNGRTMKLRTLKVGKSGESRVTEGAAVAAVAGIAAYLIVGGEVDIPAGTRANAKLAEPIILEPAPTPAVKTGE